MIKESTGFLPEKIISQGTKQLFYRLFEPSAKSIRGTILFCHGMQEHSVRYVDLARFLCSHNYVVMCYDHLGHGLTAKDNKDLGFFQIANPAQQLVDDAEYMMRYLHKLYPKVSHYALGHSMGSFVLRLLLLQVDDMLDGAIIVGTGGKNPAAGIAKGLLKLLNNKSPEKRSRFVNSAFEKMNNSKFKKEADADTTSWLSVSKSNRRAFVNDPLNGVPFSNNGFYALLTLNVNATKRDWAQPIHKTLPMLFVSGGDDPIGNFGKGVKQTVSRLKEDGFVDVELKLYEGMRHEILNEDIKEQVYDDILEWLVEHREF